MDIMLWEARIEPGEQPLAKEWIGFLRVNEGEGEETLKNEKERLEIYFMQQEDEATYLYLFMLVDGLRYADQVIQSSGSPLDTKHFECMMACIDPEDYVQLKPELALGDMSIFV